jgi:hypothetical protein
VWADTVGRTLNWSAPRNGRIRAYHVYSAVQVYGERPEMARVATVSDTFWSYAGRAPACYKIRAENDIGQIGFASDVLAIQAKDDDTFGNFRVDFQTARPPADTFFNDLPLVSAEGRPVAPRPLARLSARPNPFNPTVLISFSWEGPAKADCPVFMAVYDPFGKKRADLFPSLKPGDRAMTACWDGSNHPSGTYIVRASAGDLRLARRIVLLK